MSEVRSGAIEQMSAPLRRLFTSIEKSVSDLRAQNLRYYHTIGALCEQIRQSPERYAGKDGTPGLKLIEKALSTQARTLRKAAAFAREYDESQLKRLIALQNPQTKFQLHWGHVSFLLTVPTAERRERFAQEAVEKMLDPPALHDLIKKRMSRSGGHGRRHEMPKTIAAQLSQIKKLSQQWLDKSNNVWNGDDQSVFANVMNMPVDDMEPDMIAVLQEIEEQMQEIEVLAREHAGRAQRSIAYLSEAITRRDAEPREEPTGRRRRRIEA